ncbi:hypothetical protein T440DRAFT_542821 [Plenodomus tracheiphilus IPT5]|uniref:Uncharacterized protein n=1 Tax=Plenodomus tracheiphilus IPT5 TaxID=1408161 RepID=A0A6A7AS62_9PLEO|nr:hypothetical protein T440DRAFT_542821 [Plenodomus tracheiphilus IPT5]
MSGPATRVMGAGGRAMRVGILAVLGGVGGRGGVWWQRTGAQAQAAARREPGASDEGGRLGGCDGGRLQEWRCSVWEWVSAAFWQRALDAARWRGFQKAAPIGCALAGQGWPLAGGSHSSRLKWHCPSAGGSPDGTLDRNTRVWSALGVHTAAHGTLLPYPVCTVPPRSILPTSMEDHQEHWHTPLIRTFAMLFVDHVRTPQHVAFG